MTGQRDSDRRRWIVGVAGSALATAVCPAAGQTADRKVVVGLLSNTPDTSAPFYQAFYDGLKALGYEDGRNLLLVRRFWAGDPARLESMADEILAAKPDVVMATGNRDIATLLQRTRTVPIVAAVAQDPVGAGLVQSLAQPGGNVTGASAVAGTQIRAKRLQMLAEVKPGLSRVAVLRETSASSPSLSRALDDTAAAMGITLAVSSLSDSADVERALEATLAGRPQALFLDGAGAITHRRAAIAAFAIRHRLPAAYASRFMAESGLLLAYGFSYEDNYRRAAVYVDRILRGAKPGDLPIEQPSKFELFVNQRTARAIGVTLPAWMLTQADAVID